MGCRRTDGRKNLVRIGVAGDRVQLDPRSILGGRGGYLHPSAECAQMFVGAKVQEFRSLKRKVDRKQREDIAAALNTLLAAKEKLD